MFLTTLKLYRFSRVSSNSNVCDDGIIIQLSLGNWIFETQQHALIHLPIRQLFRSEKTSREQIIWKRKNELNRDFWEMLH
jgi:hypothetical protein